MCCKLFEFLSAGKRAFQSIKGAGKSFLNLFRRKDVSFPQAVQAEEASFVDFKSRFSELKKKKPARIATIGESEGSLRVKRGIKRQLRQFQAEAPRAI